MGFKQLPLCSAKFVSGRQMSPPPPNSLKYDICDNVYEHFDFPTIKKKTSTGVWEPRTGHKQEGLREGEEGMGVIECGLWTENVSDGERMCKVESY